ncbi:MAG: hypothetical protein ACOC8K_03570 [Gemmatimonadota bacterium]
MAEHTRPWNPEPGAGDGRVMVLTAERIPLEVRPVPSEMVGEGQICLGTHFQDRLLARSEVEEDDADLVLQLLRVPAQVGLLAAEENEGVQASLVALLPHGEVRDILRKAELEDEPWKASLEAPDYEAESRSENPVMVPLGAVVRIPEKRVSPGDLQKEAEDMLRSLMTRGGQEVVDQLLDSL